MRRCFYVTPVALFCALGTVFSAVAVAEPITRTVKVTAQSQVLVTPDEVVILLDVTSTNKELMTAKADNDKRTRAILQLGSKYQLSEKSMKIDDFTISRQSAEDQKNYPPVATLPEEQNTNPTRAAKPVRGYDVTRRIEVVLRDFDKLEPMISDALAAGATGLIGITPRTTKHREHQWEARRLAVEHAKEKAKHLAQLNGLTLGKAIEIVEDVEGDRSSVMFCEAPSSASDDRNKVNIQLVSETRDSKNAGEKSPATPSQPKTIAPLGDITIRATVNITFELK